MSDSVKEGVEADELVRRALAGSGEAFVELVRMYQAGVWRLISHALEDRASTENLVQQTFLNAYEHLDQYRMGEDFGRWVRAIARNLMREELRRAVRERRRLGRYRAYLIARCEDDGGAEEREQRLEAAVKACREQLGETPARALDLKYIRALSLEEVAKELGRTLGATRQLLFRTREAIRQCVERRLQPE